MLGAADTFRAAAVDQLVLWAEKVGVDIVKQEMALILHQFVLILYNLLKLIMLML